MRENTIEIYEIELDNGDIREAELKDIKRLGACVLLNDGTLGTLLGVRYEMIETEPATIDMDPLLEWLGAKYPVWEWLKH